MKFIYYSDSNLVSTDVLSDCDHSLFKVLSSEAEVMKEAIAENILLIVLNKPPSNDFIEWHKKNSEIKLILFTKDLTEAYLRDLQNEHYFYDLFYKYPISFFEVEKNIKLISPYTNSSWNGSQHEVEKQPSSTLDLSVDDSKFEMPIAMGNLTEEVNLSIAENDGDKKQEGLEQKKEEKSLLEQNNDLEAVLGLTSEVDLNEVSSKVNLKVEEESKADPASLLLNEASGSDELISGLLMDGAKDDLLHDDLLKDHPENMNSALVATKAETKLPSEVPNLVDTPPLSVELQEIQPELPPEVRNNSVENVTLNEVLESKEDQIFRLMSKNKLLTDEILEKEELIKKYQKEIKEIQGKYEQNLRIVEENSFQVSVLKNAHEQDIQEGKKKLEAANAKIVLLENRIEELKKVPSAPKTNETVLSVGELRKIKARQEHLEEKISLIQSDSAIQLQHREKKIIDLKRKIDLLEFDLKDSLERESEMKKKIQIAESKIIQMKQILKQVVDENVSNELKDQPKKTGSYDV